MTTPTMERIDAEGSIGAEVVEGNQVRVEAASASPAQVLMRGDAETFVLLVYGQLPLTSALDSGRLITEGDADHVAALVSRFRGV